MGLIKSINVPASLSPFSMRDIENQARAILAAAKERAEMLLGEAQLEAEKLKAEARAAGAVQGKAEGLAQGLEEGRKTGHDQALAEHRVKMTEVVTALSAACAELDASRRHLEADALQDVIELSIAIARRVTKRQAQIDHAVMTENLREAMKLVVHASDVRVVVNPKQKATLEAELPRLKMSWPKLDHVTIVEDATLAQGGCRIITPGGSIDADLDDQLDRVIADLLPEGSASPDPSARGSAIPSEPIVNTISKTGAGASSW
jgi:flagellar assembly protein FliH